MKEFISTQRLQIERLVNTGAHGKDAEFLRPDGWFCCQAWFEGGKPLIQSRGTAMTPGEANMVATAITMAIDWLVEEMAKAEEVRPISTSGTGATSVVKLSHNEHEGG